MKGYWEDIGTIRAFFEANLDLASLVPQYSFFEHDTPIYTRPRFLPGSKINGAVIQNAVISDGCIISQAQIDRCIIGIRSVVNERTQLRETVLMGADFYQSDRRATDGITRPVPPLGIGRNCIIYRAIID